MRKVPSASGAAEALKSAEVSSKEMRLYHIKAQLQYHDAYPPRLPLTSASIQRLPPVHKILRTPMKATTRNFLAANTTANETIDETADETMSDSPKRRTDVLSSSPLRYSSFGTPNSFLVAKSLLQLGLGYY